MIRFQILSEVPSYLDSHWRKSRTYPCTLQLVGACPWCDTAEKRQHAYLAGRRIEQNDQKSLCVLELPPSSLHAAMDTEAHSDLHGVGLIAMRPRKHATPEIKLYWPKPSERERAGPIASTEILRTLAKVYALPDPDDMDTEAWAWAVKARTSSPDYSPSTHQPPAD
jgi:hypothetical protein